MRWPDLRRCAGNRQVRAIRGRPRRSRGPNVNFSRSLRRCISALRHRRARLLVSAIRTCIVLFGRWHPIRMGHATLVEYRNRASARLRRSAHPTLGPAAPEVGGVVIRVRAVDGCRPARPSRNESLQDWWLPTRAANGSMASPNVAAIGGMVREYTGSVDRSGLRAYRYSGDHACMPLFSAGNSEVGGSGGSRDCERRKLTCAASEAM